MRLINIKILDASFGVDYPMPGYAKPGDAGIDLRAMNHADEVFPDWTIIHPGQCCLIGTGIAVDMRDHNIAAFIYPRSGLGHRKGLVLGNGTGVIDSTYQGEIKVSLWNRGKLSVSVERGDRIAQLVFQPIVRAEFVPVTKFEASDRGEGGFGSTGVR